jgi:hypothetical protein
MDVGAGSDHGPTASDATRSPRWFVIVVNNPLTSYDVRLGTEEDEEAGWSPSAFFGEGFDDARLASARWIGASGCL